MATYATRPAWEKRARALGVGRLAVPLGLAALVLGSLYVRTRLLDTGFWIDEGLSVGIADRSVLDIPGVLRQDGSPPLYYMLLGLWLPLAGDSEGATHALSLLFACCACRSRGGAGGCCSARARAGWPRSSPPRTRS